MQSSVSDRRCNFERPRFRRNVFFCRGTDVAQNSTLTRSIYEKANSVDSDGADSVGGNSGIALGAGLPGYMLTASPSVEGIVPPLADIAQECRH